MRTLAWCIVFLVVLVAAASVDAPVAGWVHDHGLRAAVVSSRWHLVGKWPGHFGYCAVPVAVLVGFLSRRRWWGAALVAGSGAVSGLFYVLVKWGVGRTRPFPQKNAVAYPPFHFQPFFHGFSGLWKAENQAFPSGHTCLAFATAAALAKLFPRWAVLFFAIAAVTGVERVLEGAHYPSDTVAGAALGILAAAVMDCTLRAVWSDNKDHELSGNTIEQSVDAKS